MLVKVGQFVRIVGRHAGSHRYDFAIGCGAKIIELHSMLGIQYASVRLVQDPPSWEPHLFLVPVVDLKLISEEQSKFQLIESR